MFILKLINKLSLFKKLSASIIIVAGCWQFGSGVCIYAKAQVAQVLLNHAWSKTLKGGNKVKPWDWADTYPIAKISFAKSKKHYIVLSGGSGRTMAFGPGHVNATPLPGKGGNSVLVGHRDTHFNVLEDIKLGDAIHLQLPNQSLSYKVTNTFIVNESQSEVMQNEDYERLTLITCFPFDAIQADGPLRYVVQASLI